MKRISAPRLPQRSAIPVSGWLALGFAVFLAAWILFDPSASRLCACIAVGSAALALSGIAYTLAAAVSVVRFVARRPRSSSSFPAVTLVKPLRGDEPNLLTNLSSFCRQDYPGAVQLLFGVSDSKDPALGVVAELRRLFPQADITTVVDGRQHGPNRKVSNLINMLAESRHDVLVFADSDVRVEADYLRGILGELEQPGVGLVTCLYRGEPSAGAWSRLSALATNCQFFPSAVMGTALGLAHPCCGQTIAMRRETFESIGGFGRFSRHLAEDYAIGEAVRDLGKKVAIAPFVIGHACPESDFSSLLTHELRWSRTIRAVDPTGHLGLAFTHPFALSLVAMVYSHNALWTWMIAVAALGSRQILKLVTDRALRQPRRDGWLLPAWDLVAFGIFLGSFCSSQVCWRGSRYQVDRRGMLTLIAET